MEQPTLPGVRRTVARRLTYAIALAAALLASCDTALLGPEGAIVINGVVVDGETLAGIPGATVRVTSGIDTTIQTDVAGRFVISNVAAGTYQVTATAAGYRAGSRTISTDLDLFGPDTLALAPEFPRASMRAYWPLNGTASDASGNGHHGSASGVFWTSDRFNASASAAQIDGATGAITVADNAQLAFGAAQDFAVTAWVKFSGGQSGSPAIVAKSTSGTGFELRIDDVRAVAELRSNQSAVTASNVRGLGDGRWHMIAATIGRSQGVIELYIDGDYVTQSSGDAARASLDNRAPFVLGRSTMNNRSFAGAIDDVRLFGRRLSSDDIRALYHERGW